MPDSYRRSEIQDTIDAGPHDDETWFRLQILGKHDTKHLNVTPAEVEAIRDVLAPADWHATINAVEATLAAMSVHDRNDAIEALRSRFDEIYTRSLPVGDEVDDDDLTADERKVVDLIDGTADLASFVTSCGSDDLEERITDEVDRNDLDIDVDGIDWVKVLAHFQNT